MALIMSVSCAGAQVCPATHDAGSATEKDGMSLTELRANKGAAPNAGGRGQFPIQTSLAARVGELGRSAAG